MIMNKHLSKRIVPTRGFSLVELMVSLTIFSIVMTVSTGTLLVLIDMNAKAQALYSATTNLSFALDSMTRQVRTGYRYYCDMSSQSSSEALPNLNVTDDCDEGNFLKFVREEDGVRMGYRLNTASRSIEQKEESGNWVSITADDVVIDTFEVTVKHPATLTGGSGPDRLLQPTVEIIVKGHVNNGLDTDTDFNIQSRILQRRLDII